MIHDFYTQREKYQEYRRQAQKQHLLAQIQAKKVKSSISMNDRRISWIRKSSLMGLDTRLKSRKHQQVDNHG